MVEAAILIETLVSEEAPKLYIYIYFYFPWTFLLSAYDFIIELQYHIDL